MAAEAPRKPNALINEKSPYLLQHAYNPVRWFPWGEQALQKAKDEDKPIFLSIGYSTCHWCHVMERESFEDESIAALLNEKFVPIKVDREERPDIDDIYMKAVMAMIGQGGWPLSVFLTPGLKPFYGGTYFPPSQRQGMPGFPQVLNFVSDLWRDKREEVLNNSEELGKLVQQNYDDMKAKSTLPRSILDGAYAELVTNQDEQYGGFSTAPKFPLPNYLEFLLRYYVRKRKEPALRAVKKTLQSMAAGGIHDHVGGGFHRYSTDRYWLVPHFEKMLYDNAQLARVYLEAYQVTGARELLDTAVDTLEWMLREMTDQGGGGFYSAQDADTIDGEGYYYTWTPAEIEEVIGKEAGHVFEDYFGVGPEGNFEGGRSILHVGTSVERVAARFNLDASAVRERLEEARSKLLAARATRNRPSVDDKVLSSWNGLAISALAYAYQVTGEARYLDAADRAGRFILQRLIREDGRISRRYRDGDVAIEGTLEDYAFVAAAFLDLYEASFEGSWFREALHLADKMVELLWDGVRGGFFMNPPDSAQQALPRVKEGYDGPTPSGNSAAAMTLLRLSELTGRQELREKAEATMKLFGSSMETSPFSHTYMLCALDFWFGSKEVVVVAGSLADETAQEFLREIRRRFLPNKVIVALVPGGEGGGFSSPLTEGKVSLDGKPTVYICENFACKSPATDLESLQKQLGP